MQNKTNRWLDVQIVIVALALTFSLGLWNLFAGNNHSVNSGTTSNPKVITVGASAPQPSSRIFLGGPAPQSPSFSGSAPQSSSFSAPAPVTTTGSSRP